MPINAYEALLCRNPRLVRQVLDKHESLSSFLQSVYQEMVEFLIDTSSDIRWLNLRASIAEGKPDQLWVSFGLNQNGFYRDMVVDKKILWQRNPLIARVMAVNDNVGSLASDAVNVLENWTRHHKLSLFDIRLENVWLMRGGTRVSADIVTEKQFYESTGKKIGFE